MRLFKPIHAFLLSAVLLLLLYLPAVQAQQLVFPPSAILSGQLLNVKQFGAQGDGVTDDTIGLQTALNGCTNHVVFFPAGTYIKSATLTLPSFCTIWAYGAVIAERGGTGDQVKGLDLTGKTTIAISGLTYDGNRSNRTQGGTPAAFGILMANSSRVFLRDITIQNSLWDGIECAYSNAADAATRSNYITIDNAVVTNSSRNGFSVDGCRNVTVIGGSYRGSDTNNPKAGIDVEADNGTIFNENIWFYGVEASANVGNGLTFAQFTRNSGIIGGSYSNNAGFGIAINTAGAPDNLGVAVYYPEMVGNTSGAFSRLTANAVVMYYDDANTLNKIDTGRNLSYLANTIRFQNNAGTFTTGAPEIGSSGSKLTMTGGTSGYQWLSSSGNTVQLTLPDASSAPTISSGFGTSPSVVAGSNTTALRVNVGTGGVATSGVVAMNATAPNGWNCTVNDQTTANVNTRQSASTTTTVTFSTTVAWTASDILVALCHAF